MSGRGTPRSFSRKSIAVPCPRCYKPMTSGTCDSAGCAKARFMEAHYAAWERAVIYGEKR